MKSRSKAAVAVQIGGDMSATVKELQHAMLAVLNTTAGDAVKIAALTALSSACQIHGVNISNCMFKGNDV